VMEREMIDKIAAMLGGADARKRAGAFCAQIAGLVVTRYILRLEPVAPMTIDEITRIYGPPLRLALQGPVHHKPPARHASARGPLAGE
jgi:hypothetical protein